VGTLVLLIVIAAVVIVHLYTIRQTPVNRLNRLWKKLSGMILLSMISDKQIDEKTRKGIIGALEAINGGFVPSVANLKRFFSSRGLSTEVVNLLTHLMLATNDRVRFETVSDAAHHIYEWSIKSRRIRRMMKNEDAEEFIKNLLSLSVKSGNTEELIGRLERIINKTN